MQTHKVIKDILEIRVPKRNVTLPWISIHKIQILIFFGIKLLISNDK
jgi:hypothetical protein